MITKSAISESIHRVQMYYQFLHLGKFLENYIQNNNLSLSAKNIKIETEEKSYFLNWLLIKKQLENIFINSNKTSNFWNFVEIEAFGTIISTIRELIDEPNNWFSKFLQTRLGRSYHDFEQIIRFLRNAFVHTLNSNLSIKADTFEKQKTYLESFRSTKLKFDFLYKNYFPEWRWGENYGFVVKINLEEIEKDTPLYKIIGRFELYMLCELCYNLCEVFNQKYLLEAKKPIKEKK